MADDNKLEVQIVLDDGSVVRGFAKIEKEAKKSADNVGSSFDELKTIGTRVAGAVAIATAAFGGLALSIKKAFTEVIKGEALLKVEKQFKSLADSAGLAGTDLAKRFNESLGGLADESGAFQVLNEGINRLGSNADRLPEVFTLARKATNLFGGDAIDNFRKIEEAIANGNTRQLKSIGLRIDEQKALKIYSDQVGVAVDLLSEEAKQQALMNAILDQGAQKFKNISVENATATEALQRLGVSFNNLGETVSIIAAKNLGPFLRDALNTVNEIINSINNRLKPDSIGGVNHALTETTKRLAEIKASGLSDTLQGEVELLQKQEKVLRERNNLLRFTEQQASDFEEMEKARNMSKQQRLVDEQKLQLQAIENQKKFDQELLKSRSDAQQAEFQLKLIGATQEQQDQFKREEQERLHQERINAIKKDYSGKAGISTAEFNLLMEQEDIRHRANIERINAESANRLAQIKKQEQDAQVAIVKNGLTRGIESIGAALVKGENLFQGFGNAVLGIFGDLFIRIGQGLFFQGLAIESFITSINSLFPGSGAAAAAAGLGLIIFGGALKAIAGGGGGASTSAPAPSGGGVGGGITAPIDAQNPTQISETEQKVGPSIQVTIQGDVLDSDETGLRIVDIISKAGFAQGAVLA